MIFGTSTINRSYFQFEEFSGPSNSGRAKIQNGRNRGECETVSVGLAKNKGKYPGNMLTAFNARLRFTGSQSTHLPERRTFPESDWSLPARWFKVPRLPKGLALLLLPSTLDQCRRRNSGTARSGDLHLRSSVRGMLFTTPSRHWVRARGDANVLWQDYPSGQTRKANASAVSFTSCVVLLRPKASLVLRVYSYKISLNNKK